MCLWNLIAKRRADQIIRQQYGLVCNRGCSYKDLILYDAVLECPTEEPGIPPFSDTDLPDSPDSDYDCGDVEVTIASMSYAQDQCDTDINVNFLDSIHIISITDGAAMIGDEKFVLTVNGTASLRLLPDTYLHAIAFIPTATANAVVGTGIGLDDIMYETPLDLGVVYTHVVNYQFETATTLIFTGQYTAKIYTE